MIDLFPIASAFATITSLIGQFRSERGSEEQANFNEFSAWLTEKRHEEILHTLNGNQQAITGIEFLLRQQQSLFLDSFQRIDNALASFASAMPGFSDIIVAVRPKAVLSPQALDILRQFERSGAGKLLYSHGATPRLVFTGINRGLNSGLNISDERFIEDDLQSLIDLRLLRQDYNSQGHKLYIYTRAAAALIEK